MKINKILLISPIAFLILLLAGCNNSSSDIQTVTTQQPTSEQTGGGQPGGGQPGSVSDSCVKVVALDTGQLIFPTLDELTDVELTQLFTGEGFKAYCASGVNAVATTSSPLCGPTVDLTGGYLSVLVTQNGDPYCKQIIDVTDGTYGVIPATVKTFESSASKLLGYGVGLLSRETAAVVPPMESGGFCGIETLYDTQNDFNAIFDLGIGADKVPYGKLFTTNNGNIFKLPRNSSLGDVNANNLYLLFDKTLLVWTYYDGDYYQFWFVPVINGVVQGDLRPLPVSRSVRPQFRDYMFGQGIPIIIDDSNRISTIGKTSDGSSYEVHHLRLNGRYLYARIGDTITMANINTSTLQDVPSASYNYYLTYIDMDNGYFRYLIGDKKIPDSLKELFALPTAVQNNYTVVAGFLDNTGQSMKYLLLLDERQGYLAAYDLTQGPSYGFMPDTTGVNWEIPFLGGDKYPMGILNSADGSGVLIIDNDDYMKTEFYHFNSAGVFDLDKIEFNGEIDYPCDINNVGTTLGCNFYDKDNMPKLTVTAENQGAWNYVSTGVSVPSPSTQVPGAVFNVAAMNVLNAGTQAAGNILHYPDVAAALHRITGQFAVIDLNRYTINFLLSASSNDTVYISGSMDQASPPAAAGYSMIGQEGTVTQQMGVQGIVPMGQQGFMITATDSNTDVGPFLGYADPQTGEVYGVLTPEASAFIEDPTGFALRSNNIDILAQFYWMNSVSMIPTQGVIEVLDASMANLDESRMGTMTPAKDFGRVMKWAPIVIYPWEWAQRIGESPEVQSNRGGFAVSGRNSN